MEKNIFCYEISVCDDKSEKIFLVYGMEGEPRRTMSSWHFRLPQNDDVILSNF